MRSGHFFQKQDFIQYRDKKLVIWDRWYWVFQYMVSKSFRLYFNRFVSSGWEKVPQDKPIIFAISHRNAFMDPLALVSTKDTQLFQLARGDAWKGKVLAFLFDFFHMLPLWRERDGVDTLEYNQPTFEACYDVLAKGASVGIYPEGNCINEPHIRPLKKGICRIAFGAEEKYNFGLDIQIVPAGISYTGAEKFKKWAVLQFGEPISLQAFIPAYRENPGRAITSLKVAIEHGMQQTVVHIERSPYFHAIEQLTVIISRDRIRRSGIAYEPVVRLYTEQKISKALDHLRKTEPETMGSIAHTLEQYNAAMKKLHFRENTFDRERHHPLVMTVMALYLIIIFPVFIYGALLNIVPYKLIGSVVQRKVKERIFLSSAKYLLGTFLFPLYYILLALIFGVLTGSFLSALLFFITLPIAGHIAYYYVIDSKKWWSALRYKMRAARKDPQLLELLQYRKSILNTGDHLDEISG